MVLFAATFPDKKIVVSLTRQLTCTHILANIPVTDLLKRTFYTQCVFLNLAYEFCDTPLNLVRKS